MQSNALYIGIMSGTSADGIDLALIDMSSGKPVLISSFYTPYNEATYQQITSLYLPGFNEVDLAFTLHKKLAIQFADAINTFLQQEKLHYSNIVAIGNHGQTIRHRPTITNEIQAPFTLQIGCNQTLATLTNIRVIGDFRTKDMVFGGQGAPLVPAFHQALFPSQAEDIFVLNIGGISNITFIPANKSQSVIGFDTGPGNAIMDAWYDKHNSGRFDNNGDWAKSGTINKQLLSSLLSDEYFTKPAPKSTGREYFNLMWFDKKLKQFSPSNILLPADIQATLTALTAHSVAMHIRQLSTKGNVYLCGGGTLNAHLFIQIEQLLTEFSVKESNHIGINSDALEASAFAWFAYAFDKNIPGNIPAVTGASKEVILGVQFLS